MTRKAGVVLTAEQKRKVEGWLDSGLVFGFLKKSGVAARMQSVDREEVISLLHVRLCYIARSYSPEKGKLTTYAYRSFFRALAEFWGAYSRVVALDEFVDGEVDERDPPEGVRWDKLEALFIQAELADKEKELLRAKFHSTMSNVAMGVERGITGEAVAQRCKKLVAKLGCTVQRECCDIQDFMQPLPMSGL